MKIFILNTLGIGLDMIDLISKEITIAGIIGLSEREENDSISDYVYQKNFCLKKGIDFIEVESYSLSKESDKKKILELDIDVLIVSGWQRLIPLWLINHCSICAIGSHGSPLGITKGRGRSPQNWALMFNLKQFHISIFKIDDGIDAGQIIETRTFTYSDFDDIQTSYYKVCLLTSEMIIHNLKNPLFAEQNFSNQNHEEAEYFPQRIPEDGKIDWTRSNSQIYDFVRSITRPYPGAETFINNCRIKVWKVIPFDIEIHNKYTPGQVVKIFSKKEILVKTKESFILIQDYTPESVDCEILEGMQFQSISFEDQLTSILTRHKSKHPDQRISGIFTNRIQYNI